MFQYCNGRITVGCLSGRDSAIEGLIHEINEIVHVELRLRYTKASSGENGDIMFVMDHQQFEIHNINMVAALRDCGLLK